MWASVEGSMGDEQLAFSLISAMLSRVQLAGRIDTLSQSQLDVVRAGIDTYKALRAGIPSSLPTFPLGLPGWRDSWVFQGAKIGETTLVVAVHRRGGDDEQTIELPAWLGRRPRVSVAYPAWGEADAVVVAGAAGRSLLKVTLAEENSARLLTIEA